MEITRNIRVTKENQHQLEEELRDVKVINGLIYVHEDASITLPNLEQSRNIEVRKGASLTLPKLEQSENIFVHDDASITLPKPKQSRGIDVRKIDYSLYECPYSHLEKEIGHQLHGPEGYEDVYSVWCTCGFRSPVFYLDPEDLGLKLKKPII